MRKLYGIEERTELSFVKRNLRRAISYRDMSRYSGLSSEESRDSAVAQSLSRLEQKMAFNGSIITQRGSGKDVHMLSNHLDVPIINLLNENLKRAYSTHQIDRESIIPVLKNMLRETSSFSLFRFDIISFFESFDRVAILKKVADEGLLSHETVNVLSSIFQRIDERSLDGLPRGLNISSTLSEIMMADFDRKVLEDNNVHYYSRYVDDIVLISDNRVKRSDVENRLSNLLPKGLNFHQSNEKKTYHLIPKCQKFDSKSAEKKYNFSFLGYEFQITNIKEEDGDFFSIERRHLTVDISKNKIEKIKRRLLSTFINYLEGNPPMGKDYKELILRLKFLTGNYNLPIPNKGILIKSGIYYNYRHTNTDKKLKELDCYLRNLLFSSKHKFSRRIARSIPLAYRRELSNFSFLKGFNKKIFFKFSEDDLKVIKDAWR